MVTATVETYPEETLGVLIGVRTAKRILVQYAIAYQTARRSRDEVYPHPKRSQRMDNFLEKVTRLEVVGDFHSHPEVSVDKVFGIKLSETDKNSMLAKKLGIVIAIDKDEKEREWRHLSKGSLKGGVYPYSVKMTSWFKTEESEFKISKIHCPFALGLGR
jgi:proteasome lid subunit RPN8/RPN11